MRVPATLVRMQAPHYNARGELLVEASRGMLAGGRAGLSSLTDNLPPVAFRELSEQGVAEFRPPKNQTRASWLRDAPRTPTPTITALPTTASLRTGCPRGSASVLPQALLCAAPHAPAHALPEAPSTVSPPRRCYNCKTLLPSSAECRWKSCESCREQARMSARARRKTARVGEPWVSAPGVPFNTCVQSPHGMDRDEKRRLPKKRRTEAKGTPPRTPVCTLSPS